MKKTSWLAGCGVVLGVLVATGALAQANSNALPTIPPPATATSVAPVAVPAPAPETVTAAPSAPDKKAAPKHLKKTKKHVVKKAKAAKAKATAKADATLAAAAAATNTVPAIPLVPGDATVTAAHVNVRGQAGLRGEVVTHLKKGDHVNVLAALTLDKHKADEPAEWAKISLPADTKVWLDSDFVDATTKAVKAKKLNLRGGPGENYSVLGFVEAGTPVTPAVTKGNWWQIDTPTNAYAFVAASYLTQSAPETSVAAAQPAVPGTTEAAAPATNAAPAAPEVPTTTNTVSETPAIVAAAPSTPVVDTNTVTTTSPAPTNNVAAVLASETAAAAAAAAATNSEVTDTNPPPPRIVTHEGIVRPVSSIIAPTYFELDDQATGHAINYLFTSSTNLDLNRYNKLHIIVTGEEGLAKRWRKTPVLTIQRIQVVE